MSSRLCLARSFFRSTAKTDIFPSKLISTTPTLRLILAIDTRQRCSIKQPSRVERVDLRARFTSMIGIRNSKSIHGCHETRSYSRTSDFCNTPLRLFMLSGLCCSLRGKEETPASVDDWIAAHSWRGTALAVRPRLRLASTVVD
jgi:hypothetical protein